MRLVIGGFRHIILDVTISIWIVRFRYYILFEIKIANLFFLHQINYKVKVQKI